MKAVLSGKVLSHFAPFLKTCVANRTLPILRCVRIRQGVGGTEISTTDLDRHLSVSIGSPTDPTAFDCCLNAAEVFKIAADAKGDLLTFEYDRDSEAEKNCSVRFKNMVRALPGYPGSEFPVPLAFGKNVTPWSEMPADFIRGIQLTETALSHDETRYVLNGHFLNFAPPTGLVGCDGRRLEFYRLDTMPVMTRKMEKAFSAVGNPGIIIPRSKFFANPALLTPFQFRMGGSPDSPSQDLVNIAEFRFAVGPFTMTFQTRLIEGNYPNWRQVMPPLENRKFRVIFPPETVNATRAIAAVNSPKIKNTVLRIEDSECEFSRDGSSISVPVVICDGQAPDGFRISFDAKFLHDAVSSGHLVADFSDADSPAVFRIAQPHREHVIMPMRVTGSEAA
jgi:DNA polymerase III sliding clamp (beta) subunit (PCNA family)